MELSGGLDWIPQGARILVRPNLNTPDPPPGSTSPEVFDAVLTLLEGRSPREVIVGEKSMIGLDTREVAALTGLDRIAEAHGASFVSFDELPWEHYHLADARSWPRGFSMPRLLREVDAYITLPVAKTHWTATFTMALKGQVGLTADEDRRQLPHGRGLDGYFGDMIAELSLACLPDLVVMDATKCFVTDGPNVGTLREPGLIIASRDTVANDVVGLALLKHLGTTPKIQSKPVWAQPQIKRAIELRLGVADPDELVLLGDGAPELEALRVIVADLGRPIPLRAVAREHKIPASP